MIAFYAVAMTLIAVWVQSALRDRRQVDLWHEHTQTTLLAEAGLRRAVARVNRSGNAYSGEQWQITSQELGLPHDAQVEIRITDIYQDEENTAESASPRKRIVVVADYPVGRDRRNRVTKEIEIDTNSKQTNNTGD